jgi:tetrahydromethanopterin S-methyltransferase subunit D
VASDDSSCFLASSGLGIGTVLRGRLGNHTGRSGAAMDWLERSFLALMLLSAVGAAVSIAWIMLI